MDRKFTAVEPVAGGLQWLRRTLRATAALVALVPALAWSSTITVNSLADTTTGCTLRNAIATSNDNAAHGTCTVGGTSNTIQFSVSGVITLNGGPLNIYQHSVVIDGGSVITIDGNGDRIFDNFDPGPPVALTIRWLNLTLQNGDASVAGSTAYTNAGAIFIDSLTTGIISACVFNNNLADSSGGAIENLGMLSITDSTFSSNSAPGQGGAIRNIGQIDMTGSTFSANTGDSGGAIWHSSGSAAQHLNILNSTFSGNSATTAGGAISADDNTSLGAVSLGEVTIANNVAPTGGGIYNNNGAAFNLELTIIASNSAPTGPDCSTAVALSSFDYNVFGSLSGCIVSGITTHNVTTGTPNLGSLANNGGPTQTIALLPGSPAIDIFATATCPTPTDQRGTARPIGPGCDAGAFEAPLQLTVNPTALPPGAVAAPYSQLITAVNGTGPYTFAVTAGALPAGVSLDTTTGALAGTPTAGGTFGFTITATDTFSSLTASQAYTVPFAPPTIVLSPASLPNGTFAVAYSQAVSASGGTTPYTYSISVGALPSGLGIDPSTGAITGTPTAAGPFSFTVSASDSSTGTGPYSGSQGYSVTISATVPSTPTIGTATAGDGQATVSYTGSGSNGGSAITSYTAVSSPGGFQASGLVNPLTVTGLTNGTAYTFTVRANNAVGSSTPSGASNSVTPKANQTITFANPGAQNFGTTPTLGATSDSGLTVTFTSATTGVCTITAGGTLTFVTAGSCTINADQAGNSAFNAATTLPRTFTVNAVVPGAPTIGTATAGDTQATVTFTAPAFTGGATITGYTATSSPGGITATGATSPMTITGLTNGTPYTFTVTATNSAGTGSASAPSNSVTPRGSQTITFANPGAQNFGTTPTLTATSTSALAVTFTSATTAVCTITTSGVLTFVTTGSCTINADQTGNTTFLAAPTVPQTFNVNAVVPGAPAIGTATPGNSQATISFTAPVFTGGAAITGYTVTCNPGGITATGAASPITVTGLSNSTGYLCSVTATNSAGTSLASATVNVTPSNTSFTGPSATGTGNITATFTGGGPGCSYTVSQFIPVTGNAASPPTGSAPSGVTFPQGLFEFTTSGCTPGSAITMTITYPNPLPANTNYWKYGPTASNHTAHWYILPATVLGNTVTFTINDGGNGDDDLNATNGIIVDQGGPGFGGNNVPTLSAWALMLLAMLLGLFGVGMSRARRP